MTMTKDQKEIRWLKILYPFVWLGAAILGTFFYSVGLFFRGKRR